MERSMSRAGRAGAAVAATLCLLVLGACEQIARLLPASTGTDAPPAEVTTAAHLPVPPRPARKPPSRRPPRPVPSRPVPADTPAVPPPSAPEEPADGAFDRLNGLDQAATTVLLGEPSQRAEAPPATIWRYLTRDCELDVYFYLDLRTNQMRALHYEVRNHDAAERPQHRCYEQLVTERGTRAEPASGTDHPR